MISLESTVYLEEGEGPSVTRESQTQHALQLWDGDVEGSSTGESLDDRLRQIGGEEAQLKPEHAKLKHNRWTHYDLFLTLIPSTASKVGAKLCLLSCIIYYDVYFWSNNSLCAFVSP